MSKVTTEKDVRGISICGEIRSSRLRVNILPQWRLSIPTYAMGGYPQRMEYHYQSIGLSLQTEY